MIESSRLIVASARLPCAMKATEKGWQAQASAGGLVTGLRPLGEKRQFDWVGWPGSVIDPEEELSVVEVLKAESKGKGFDLHPVFLSEEDVSGFYEGFSNSVLWPLFHGFVNRSAYSTLDYEAYVRVNQRFADAIAARVTADDYVWIHDYQLCLVPDLLRERGVTCPIGFFLHVPFPSSETYRTLPVREELLKGLLGADFLGFHAYEYVSHFRKTCLRVLGLDSGTDVLKTASRRVHLGVAPIGIDPQEIRDMAAGKEATAELETLRAAYGDKRIVIGVDRLDYTKGIPEKLLAFETLLRTHPEWRGQVILIQVAAPSRTGIDEYQSLKRQVDELVGRINGEYGAPGYTPIVYVNQHVSRERLVGMYKAADIALVTPVRDGMNLVALEYIAARGERGGSLILSEFAGAANLLPGARLVNPYNIDDIAMALGNALAEPLQEPYHMLEFVENNTAQRWAEQVLEKLRESRSEVKRDPSRLKMMVDGPTRPLVVAREPLFLLDYDGTLRGYESSPHLAHPTPRILGVLSELSSVARVYVVSGRDAHTLERWLGNLPIGLVSEHGLAIRPLGASEWERDIPPGLLPPARVVELFREFVRRTPGSHIETKETSIAWHYRTADAELGAFQSKELIHELAEYLTPEPYDVLIGNKVIEVRHSMCSKGKAVERVLSIHPDVDAVFSAGDDTTDEDMLTAVASLSPGPTVLTWVGAKNAAAQFWCDSSRVLLDELANYCALRRQYYRF